jgi:hypothetical protein
MKALVWISAIVCVIYGAIVLAAYETRRAEALNESRSLQQVEATVLTTQRCRGKSLCYFTIAEYQLDGNRSEVRVAGEIGKQGTVFSLFVIPGSERGFLSHDAYVKYATSFLPLMLFPLAIFLFPLLLAVAAKFERANQEAVPDKQVV